ncbi:hypothetical protein C7999DRAFT_15966 [Corynascus novoguineensis]|uniref:Uncharacterized protein n=1 Tax=Corynascus novoguineensis TaxID=1126955 RepID=A0AAN7CQ59_9PEZI|nr:hypothetical protein C7999DRAFT_15966 [Corynascus novoguineensis]
MTTTSSLPPLPDLPIFATAYLDHRRVPEPTLPSRNDPTGKNTTNNQNKKNTTGKTRPLAASRHPAAFYSQYKCPICGVTIAEEDGADFVGHAPCLHRGPCARSGCVRAYYGTSRKWGAKGDTASIKPLYCQAAGCGRRIEGWCLARAVMSQTGRAVVPLSVRDPKVEREWERANAKLREGKAREGGMGAHGEDKNRRKKKDGRGEFELGSISGSKVLDAGLVVVMCCGAVCCFPCGGVASALMA